MSRDEDRKCKSVNAYADSSKGQNQLSIDIAVGANGKNITRTSAKAKVFMILQKVKISIVTMT